MAWSSSAASGDCCRKFDVISEMECDGSNVAVMTVMAEIEICLDVFRDEDDFRDDLGMLREEHWE